MTFDPRNLGCNCDDCPLGRERVTPVPPEIRQGAKLLTIGEAPGMNEEREGRPFIGASGKELDRALRACGVQRRDVSLSNALLCRPVGGNFKKFMQGLGKRNRRRRKKGETPWPSPVVCCRPRLMREVANANGLLILGKTAYESVSSAASGEAKFFKWRGFPQRVGDNQIPAVCTVHPAYVLRFRKWQEVFRADVAKAFRHAAGKLHWKNPTVLWDPTAEQLVNVLAALKGQVVGVDAETDGIDPEVCGLRCVAVGSAEVAVGVSFISVEKPPRIPRCPPEVARRAIAEFLKSARICGNNINSFDRPLLARHGMPLPDYARVFDNLPAHHCTDPEMPHGLDFMMSLYSDSVKHKDVDHEAWDSDEELIVYCCLDASASARMAPKLAYKLRHEKLEVAYKSDVQLQKLCVGMHRAGILVDQVERARHSVRLQGMMAVAQKRAEDIAGRDINLGSHQQIREYLFSDLDLNPTSFWTDGGEPSTSKDAVYELLLRALPEKTMAFLDALMDYRRPQKIFTTYVKKDVTRPDTGRVHSFFNPCSNLAGRINSSEPNMLNLPSRKVDVDTVRSMFIPAPGCVFVYADMATFHLRLAAAVANDVEWLKAFADAELDLHTLNAAMFFSILYELVSKAEREFTKQLTYALLYKAMAQTVWRLMKTVRDPETGERPYAMRPLAEIRILRDRFLAGRPAIVRWWIETLERRRRNGELRTRLLNRKHTFLDSRGGDEEESQIINFDILGLEGDVMGGWEPTGMGGISGKVAKRIGWPWDETSELRGLGGAGIVLQNYDSIMIEVAEAHAEYARDEMTRLMTTTLTIEGRSVVIPAEGKILQRME